MEQFLVWDTSLSYSFFNIYGNLNQDLMYLQFDGRFSKFTPNIPNLQKLVFFIDGLWFMGYYMNNVSVSKIMIQRAYGKLALNPSKSSLKNKNKYIVCDIKNVLLFDPEKIIHYDDVEEEKIEEAKKEEMAIILAPAQSLTTRNVKIPIMEAYTLFMIKDMIRNGKRLKNLGDFTIWFNETYLIPSRTNTTELFTIPQFNDIQDALVFLNNFKTNYPEQYSIFDEETL
jgi:hypothetical protein